MIDEISLDELKEILNLKKVDWFLQLKFIPNFLMNFHLNPQPTDNMQSKLMIIPLKSYLCFNLLFFCSSIVDVYLMVSKQDFLMNDHTCWISPILLSICILISFILLCIFVIHFLPLLVIFDNIYLLKNKKRIERVEKKSITQHIYSVQ